jgi:protein TonB
MRIRFLRRWKWKQSSPAATPHGQDTCKERLNANAPIDNNAPEGSYTVVVQFIVDKGGNISDVKGLTKHGYGMEEEAIRVIKRGPKWTPAIQNGRNVNAYRKQPVTFVVQSQ